MSTERQAELDAAVGAMVKDLRAVLGWVACGLGFVVILGVIQVGDAVSEGRWVGAALAAVAVGVTAHGCWDLLRREAKYGGPKR